MLFFNQQIPPSTRAHMEAQFSFAAEMSKQLFGAVQRINELNIQIAQSALQDTLSNTREVITSQDPFDAMSVAAGQAQPTAERMRNYQQQLTDIAARTQVDLAKTAESHIPEASRTASAMADEVARRTEEETQKATQRQRAAIDKMASSFQKRDSGGDKGAGAPNVH